MCVQVEKKKINWLIKKNVIHNSISSISLLSSVPSEDYSHIFLSYFLETYEFEIWKIVKI